MRVVLLLVLVALFASAFATWIPNPQDLEAFTGATGNEPFPVFRRKVISAATDYAMNSLISDFGLSSADIPKQLEASEYPYFAWIPPYTATAMVDGPAVTWQAKCFQDSSLTVKSNPANASEFTLTFVLSKPKSLLCNDFYLLATVCGVQIKSFFMQGTHTLTWTLPADARPAEVWDLHTKGIRVFTFMNGPLQTVSDLLSTVVLFASELTKNVPSWVSAANLDFLAKYAGVKMTPRANQSVSIDESTINSGDFFGVIRLDGLDPMLAWAMGSTTGHTTVALRDPTDGVLYITESTVNDSYWPTNGIQKTPYQQWVLQARAAGYSVVHAPLTAEAAARFNVTAAWEAFNALEGLDYGYHNLLFGWIDTPVDNYPCLPPDYTQCLQIQHVEVLVGLADRLAYPIANLLFNQALAHRVNVSLDSHAAEILFMAYQKGIDVQDLPTIIESDTWDYATTRYQNTSTLGKSMVCCTFVCNMWKAGGAFGDIADQVNCAELTNWDDYVLTILDPKPVRPAACQAADPNNNLCQIEGEYTLELNNYATKAPYAHMAEHCPSLPPAYKKPDDC